MTNEAAEQLRALIASRFDPISAETNPLIEEALATAELDVGRLKLAIRIVVDAEEYLLQYNREAKRLAEDVAAAYVRLAVAR